MDFNFFYEIRNCFNKFNMDSEKFIEKDSCNEKTDFEIFYSELCDIGSFFQSDGIPHFKIIITI